MLVYILKFSACLTVFLLFYKLFLEKEDMHTIKRFYLLTALVLAFGIPLITLTHYVEASTQIEPQVVQETLLATHMPKSGTTTNYLPTILWGFYALGVLLFGSRFLYNLTKVFHRILQNPKYRCNTVINVLLKDSVAPHTFFRYIFLKQQLRKV